MTASPNYIRNVQHKPTGITSDAPVVSVENPDKTVQQRYWLGETLRRTIKEDVIDGFSGDYLAAIVPLNKAGAAGLQIVATVTAKLKHHGLFRKILALRLVRSTLPTVSALSHSSSSFLLMGKKMLMKTLRFQLAELDTLNTNVAFGTFDVLIRDASDADTSPEVLERFS